MISQKFGKTLAGIAVLGTLAIVGTLMDSRQLALQGGGGPAVTIDPTQLPLPISGTVSGTVAATQSGMWNVGITGTPMVQVSGTPNVNIDNSATVPAITQDVSKLASQAVALDCFGSPGAVMPCQQLTSRLGFTVPPSQSLMVTSVELNSDMARTNALLVCGLNPGFDTYGEWQLAQGPTQELVYPSGLALPSGCKPAIASASSPELIIRGYLTSK